MLTSCMKPEEQSRRFAKARKVMGEFASIRIDEKKREMEDNKIGKQVRRRRGDFLTLLVEANMGSSLPEGQRLSDETIIDGALGHRMLPDPR